MNQEEIKVRAEELLIEIDKKVEAAAASGQFILDKELQSLEQELSSLQSQCNHEFENGYCVNCGKENGNG